MDKVELFYKVLDVIGWIWFYFKKPFIAFGKLNWKVQTILIIIFLGVFDNIRFLLFDFFIWILTK